MKFIHRLAYYLFGFSIGLIFLYFFLSKKEASCDYSPNARVKKNIRIKPKIYSEAVLLKFQKNNLDTSLVSVLLNKGKVDFSESNTNLDICNIYTITGMVESKELKLKVENCPEEAIILSLSEID
ncbi:MAG: hypothetical protein WDZ45_03120 [Flavobacteriaceae bacterium]